MGTEAYARTAPAKSLTVTPIERPFSNFTFQEQNFPQVWPLWRIMSQVRQLNGKSMVVEELTPSTDLIEENEDIAVRCSGFRNSRAWRLSFFTKRFKTRRGLASATSDQFLGYAIIKRDRLPDGRQMARVYESVIRTSRHPNNFVHGAQTWRCAIGGDELEIDGYLYAQQNNVTNVCAHVALRTVAARFHPSGDMSYREMNHAAGVDHRNVTVGDGKGLNTGQMQAILHAAGAGLTTADYLLPTARHGTRMIVPFQQYIYGSVESGYPAIILFATSAPDSYHAVPVFGHTFNEDTWVPRAQLSYFTVGGATTYTPSESWVSMYIAHDDNWGSNFCIPRGYLHVRQFCDRLLPKAPCPLQEERVAYVMATFPRDVRLTPLRAEVIGADYLLNTIRPKMPTHVGVWAERLRWYAGHNLLVLRPLLIDGTAYSQHLRRIRDWEGNSIDPDLVATLEAVLQGKLWMVELSLPRLFSANRRKLGEVLLRADIAPGAERDWRNFVIARLPGCFALYAGGEQGQPRYSFVPSGVPGHVELYGCEERT